MDREKLEATLAELEQELGRAQQQENAARVARLRLEGAVAVLKQLLQEQEGENNGGNN